MVRSADISRDSRSVQLTGLSIPGRFPWYQVLRPRGTHHDDGAVYIFAAFGIGILLRQRWGLILALLYFAQVVISHIIFFVTNFSVPSQVVHVKITAVEALIVFLIFVYLWIRSRSLLVHSGRAGCSGCPSRFRNRDCSLPSKI